MASGVLLRQVLLNFCHQAETVRADISAIAQTPDDALWIGSDELNTLERLFPTEKGQYGYHQQYRVDDFVDLQDEDEEIDIEGLDFSSGYLWVVGSHSTKRKRVKGKDPAEDIERLLNVQTEVNRYLLARIPIVNGVPVKRDATSGCQAARLATKGKKSVLIRHLRKDPHLGPFLKMGLPSKDNGFDIEAIAAKDHRLFLGLRGPVLRGMAIILEIELKQAKARDELTLKKLENGEHYRKHFVDLNGLGVRDLCFQGEDLLILAGPTMPVASAMQLFRFRDALAHRDDTLWLQSSESLVKLFDFPLGADERAGNDKAEGLCLLPEKIKGGPNGCVLVVYDSPSEKRLKTADSILADIFQL
ncbi:MAG: DUF3616 domain-containing protein [Cyanobacteria bacterium J06614_10]